MERSNGFSSRAMSVIVAASRENFRVMFMRDLPEIVCEEKLIFDEQDAAACK